MPKTMDSVQASISRFKRVYEQVSIDAKSLQCENICFIDTEYHRFTGLWTNKISLTKRLLKIKYFCLAATITIVDAQIC